MLKSNFKNDLEREAIIGQYLDKYFYSKMYLKGFKRIETLDKQYDGIDVEAKTQRGTIIKIDEKSQSSDNYIINHLPTFAFELSYEKDGVRKEGWLFKENSTDFFVLIYAICINCDIRNFNKYDDIEELELLYLEKSRFIEYLKKYN